MEKDEDLLETQIDGQEELLDLSLDDLSPDDIDQGETREQSDEEIIELLDLVEKGEKGLEEANGEVAQFLKEDEQEVTIGDIIATVEAVSDKEEDSNEEESLSESDLDLSDLSFDSDYTLGEEEKSEEDVGLEDIGIEIDLEDVMEEEPNDEMSEIVKSPLDSNEAPEHVEEPSLEEPDTAIEAEPSEGDVDEETLSGEDITGPETEESTQRPDVEGMIGIYEEKIEAVVKKVVEEVLERVARETMAGVAEKVITEAIDTLKQSLESNSD